MLLDWYVDNGTDEQVAIVSHVMEFLSTHEMFKRGSKILTIDIDFVNTPGGGCVHMDNNHYEIEINKRLVPKTLQRVLAHEMVHLYQMTVLKDPYSNHNSNFYAWKNRFKLAGLGLARC